MQTPILTDTAALARNRARALAMNDPALFLHSAAIDEIKERLTEVNRSFKSIAIVTGFRDFWQAAFPNARVIPDAEVLDLDPATHDLVIHGLALHWANDPVGQLIQCRNALRPDGLCIAALFGGQSLNELRACLAEAEVAVSGGMSPHVVPMAEIRDLGGLLQRAGFALPVADTAVHRVHYRDAFHLMTDLRAMGEANALASRSRRPLRRSILTKAANLYADAFPAKEGKVLATFETIYLTGWAPDDAQQRPLRPGSAAQRLANALNTTEQPLPATKRQG